MYVRMPGVADSGRLPSVANGAVSLLTVTVNPASDGSEERTRIRAEAESTETTTWLGRMIETDA